MQIDKGTETLSLNLIMRPSVLHSRHSIHSGLWAGLLHLNESWEHQCDAKTFANTQRGYWDSRECPIHSSHHNRAENFSLTEMEALPSQNNRWMIVFAWANSGAKSRSQSSACNRSVWQALNHDRSWKSICDKMHLPMCYLANEKSPLESRLF
jgi:hypothetical protein